MNEPQVEGYPRWREALRLFHLAGFKFGDVVSHKWFSDALRLESINSSKLVRIADFQKRQFFYAESLERIRLHLLRDDQIYLENEFGVGYRLVPPAEQTVAVMQRGMRSIVKEIEKMYTGLTCIQVDALDDRQRVENAEARAKVSMLGGMARNRLPKPFED